MGYFFHIGPFTVIFIPANQKRKQNFTLGKKLYTIIMATYTGIEGQGKLTTATISGNTTCTITTPASLTGSAYFTLEASARNSSGSFDSSTPTIAIGTYSNLTNVKTLVTSSYILSVVVENGGGSFQFNPSSNIAVGSAYVRGTGGITVQI